MLGITPAAVRQARYRDKGSMPPAIRIGKALRWDPEVVAEWLREKTEAPSGIGASQNLAPGANQKAGRYDG